jgi:uracil-DNA glycosylase
MDQSLKEKFKYLLGEEWFRVFESYFDSEGWYDVTRQLVIERIHYTIYPEKGSDLLFKAFRTTPLSKVKVVILGQDPYHDGSYDGFAFSNREKLSLSPSLRNIFKELESDVYQDFVVNLDPNLERWAKQGVLLINTAHTVRKGEAGSHLLMWDIFTRKVVRRLSKEKRPIVWILWGSKAKRHLEGVELPATHLKLISAHPSPYSAAGGFFGSKPFTKTNDYLRRFLIKIIDW